MTKSSLPTVIAGVSWTTNIHAAFSDKLMLAKLEAALLRIAVWSKQLEVCNEGNPALCFVREMQVAAQQSAALLGLCIYKASAASARTILETCLYYTYFRTHPQELTSLIRVKKFFVTKSEILDYHRQHTASFMNFQEVFGLLGNLETWYSSVSAVVHGQIPGAWNAHTSLSDICFCAETHALALNTILSGEELVHQILLCTAGQDFWPGFAPDAKRFLLKGLAGDRRAALCLDLA